MKGFEISKMFWIVVAVVAATIILLIASRLIGLIAVGGGAI